MKKVPFGRTGLEVSVLGFGGSPIGYLQTERQKAGTMLNFLLDSGVNLIDTAASYKESETVIGETVGHRRKEYILVSKCGHGMSEISAPAWSAENVTQTIERSLKRLKTDVIDVVFLHSCDLETLKKGDALRGLVLAHKAGKVRFPGYSGDNEAAAYAASLPEISVIETSVNIVDQANIDQVLPVVRKHNVGVLAKRPIANAAWRPMDEWPQVFLGYIQPYKDRFGKMKIDPKSLGFTGVADDVWPEIALRFTLSQPGVSCAIIGTTNPDNARANIAAANKGSLPVDVVGKIRQAFAKASAGESWPGLT